MVHHHFFSRQQAHDEPYKVFAPLFGVFRPKTEQCARDKIAIATPLLCFRVAIKALSHREKIVNAGFLAVRTRTERINISTTR
jgi:hypothetical protein